MRNFLFFKVASKLMVGHSDFLQAYASGCDVVILLSGFTRVQIISGSLYGYKEVSCIDCCDSDGKVLA